MVAKLIKRMIANCSVGRDGLHDPNLRGVALLGGVFNNCQTDLCCPDMVGEVLVVRRWSGKDEEHCMTHQSDTVLHTAHHLLPYPLGYQVVTEDNDGGTSDKPEGVEAKEWVVKPTLVIGNTVLSHQKKS